MLFASATCGCTGLQSVGGGPESVPPTIASPAASVPMTGASGTTSAAASSTESGADEPQASVHINTTWIANLLPTTLQLRLALSIIVAHAITWFRIVRQTCARASTEPNAITGHRYALGHARPGGTSRQAKFACGACHPPTTATKVVLWQRLLTIVRGWVNAYVIGG
jgi:hypothetical protein